MPLLKEDKKQLAQQYIEAMQWAKNVVLIKHAGIPVNEMNGLRMWLADTEWNLQVVKKRVLLKWLEGKFDGVTLDQLDGSVAILLSHNEDDEHAPLKAVQKSAKQRKKDKAEYSVEYVWWRYEWAQWKDSEYVTTLANLPSKEELIGKLVYMLSHPVTSFARVLKAIADDQWWDEPVAEEPKEEPAEEVKEEVKEEPKAEEKPEEKKEESSEEQTEQKEEAEEQKEE